MMNDCKRAAERITGALGDAHWQPRRAHIEGARNELIAADAEIERLQTALQSVDVTETDGRVYVGLTIPETGFLAAYVRPGFKTFARDWKRRRDLALNIQQRQEPK